MSTTDKKKPIFENLPALPPLGKPSIAKNDDAKATEPVDPITADTPAPAVSATRSTVRPIARTTSAARVGFRTQAHTPQPSADGDTSATRFRTSIYLDTDTLDLLDELTFAIRAPSGRRLNRCEVLRSLVRAAHAAGFDFRNVRGEEALATFLTEHFRP